MSVMTPPTVDHKSKHNASADAAARDLQDHLQSTRRRLITQRIGVGFCLIAAGTAVSLAVSATADYFLVLSTVWRATWLVGSGLVAAVIGILGWRRWVTQYTLSNAAADAENKLSQFGQRLRTTLDYEQQTPPPAIASPSLLNALHRETQHVSEQAEWDDAIDPRPLWAAVFVGFVVGCAWVIALVAAPEFRVATARALVLPAEYTTVTFAPQTVTVPFGASVLVQANVAGRPIDAAQLRYRSAGTQDKWQAVDLLPAEQAADKAAPDSQETPDDKVPVPLHGKLVAKLSDLKQDVEFVVVAGPRDLSPGSIRVLQPLKLEKSSAHIRPPEYAHRESETVAALDLKVLEGSTVELQMRLNRAPSQATLVRLENNSAAEKVSASATPASAAGAPADIPLTLKDQQVVATLADLRSNASFTFSAQAADGMTLDPVKVNIRVQLDRKPQVKFIQPEEELVVTPTTEVPVIVEASDDIGLMKVGVMYQIGNGPMKPLIEQHGDSTVEPFRLTSQMMLEDHQLRYPDAVTYYAFAEDNYFGKPRRTTTPLRFIDIRPYKMEFQVVDSNCSCNGSSTTLEELIVRQRQNLSHTFAIQDESNPAPAMLKRLTKYQTEILDATTEFTAGLAAMGITVPTLEKAVTKMEQAVAALEAPQLSDAVSAEQEALSALIHARKNLRNILKQSSSQSASACRKFDRQQRQKLRMPEKKEDPQQQLAAARAKLDDLAKRERKWSEDAKTSCQNPSSSRKPGKPSQSPSSAPSQASQQAQSPQQPPQSSDQPQNSPSSEAKSATPTPAEVAAAQEKLQKELAELQKELDQLAENGKAAGQQAQQAAESMQQGLDEVKKQNGQAAAEAGERSAEQLEELSAHLAAMNARDFGQRLDQAQQLAQQLSTRQESVAKKLAPGKQLADESAGENSAESSSEKQSGPQRSGGSQNAAQLAREERALSTQTEMLADLLERLKGDAATESGGVREKLEQVHAENPPHDIAAGMRQAADDLQAARTAQAGREAAQARDGLKELTRTLTAARAEYAQPQLKELMELEEQLAQLQKQLQREKEAGAAGQKWEELEPRLDRMAQADRRLADALRQLREGSPARDSQAGKPGSSQPGKASPKPGEQLQAAPYVAGGQQLPDGFYPGVKLGDFNSLREVSKALQAKIQEAILAAALLDADQPVPPAYKALVEKYYRTLSDDLK